MGIDPVQADEKLIMFTRTKHFFPAVCALAFLVIASGASAQSLQDATGASNPCKDPLAALNPACPPAGSGTSGSGPSVSPSIPMLNMPGMSLPNMDGVSGPRTPREPEVRELPAAPISPDPPNEFQRFVAASVGKVLPIFGASLFEKIPSTFAPVGRVPVTAGYVVGPGDQILLRVWGQVNLNQELTVDRGGAVYIPQVGSITVSGLPFEKLSGFLRTQLERVFRNFDMSVNLGQLRSIQIFVVGKVRRPGAYTVSSLSTLVDALFSSGGPSAEGSMRRIQLRRASRLVSEFDLYDLLLKGDKSGDAALLDGDVIYVASAGPQAAVAGSVKNPAIYEMKAERTLGALLELSGGLTQVADGRRATLERVLNHDARQMLDLALDAAGLAIPLEDGDVLQILPVPLRFTNAVTLRGNVANPGRFPWHAGMRLRDIIPDRESLVTRSYWRNQNLLGFAPEIASAEMILDPAAKLALMNAGKSDAPKLALKPAVKLESADPPINWAYAVVERRNPRDLSAQLLPFSPARLLLENNLDENLELRPGDVVTIFSQTDIRVPQSQQVRFVRLEGEFRAAGIYTAKDGETLKQLIDRAGGLTPEAYLYGAQFTRESTRKDQQARLDGFIEEMEQELARSDLKQAGNSTDADDLARQKAQEENAHQLIERMRNLKATGRIVLGLDQNQNDLAKLMELPLEDGDMFIAPPRPATINVIGAVYNPNSFLYEARLRVADYLREAGGSSRTADKDRIFIVRADGAVIPKQGSGRIGIHFDDLHMNAGDSLVVPDAFPKMPLLRGLRDWTQVFSQLVLGAAAINILR